MDFLCLTFFVSKQSLQDDPEEPIKAQMTHLPYFSVALSLTGQLVELTAAD